MKSIVLKRVVITGMGALSPIGNTVDDFWQALISGKSGGGLITKFDTTHFKTKIACELKNFDPLNHFEKSEARKYDPFTQYALVAVNEAITTAHINLEKINKDRVGVIWGSGNGGIHTFNEQVIEFAKGNGTPRFNPYFIPKIIVDIASGVIAIKYGFRGPNFTTVSACATSNTAIIEAYNYIQFGKADMIITGGSEAAINESGIGGFNACKALSQRNDDPATASRPFDIGRDGFVMGEGAGALVLEEYTHALKRNATIYAEIIGGGMSADAYHLTATHPEGDGAFLGMQLALEEAGIQPQDVDYLNPHATSTPQGDVSELKATERLFGKNNDNLHISATKSMTGHLLGAAGAIEAIATIKTIQTNCIPPTINHFTTDPSLNTNLQIIFNTSIKKEVNIAMSNTFGFGGHNATAIFKKAPVA